MIGASFTSCSNDKDLYDPTANALKFLQDYQAAFISVFGQPAANQTWGFGSPAQARMTRAGNIQPDHNFNADIPSKPTSEEMSNNNNFIASIQNLPFGILSYTAKCEAIRDANNWNYTPDGFSEGDCYIDESYTGKVSIYSGNSKLYVSGNCDMTDGRGFSLGANMEIYLLEGATFTVPSGFGANSKVYLANGSHLIVNSGISTGNVSYYSKGGSITVNGSMVVNGDNELFMEGGSFSVTGELFQLQPATACFDGTAVDIDGKIDVNNGWISNERPKVIGLYYQTGGSFAATSNDLVCNSGKFFINVNSSFNYIEANGTGIIVNKAGTMTSATSVRVTNGESVMINDGDLFAEYLGTEGSALFQNNGTATITTAASDTYGRTIVNSNNNTWVNNGTFTTDYFVYNAGSSQVINNCRMIVNEDFNINLGDNPGNSSFQMDTESSVLTKNFNAGGVFSYSYKENNLSFNGGPFYIYMNSGSVFDVTETATINATKANYGIYGPSAGEYAVLHANKIQCAPGQENQGFKVTYGGAKLAVISETTHFPQGNDGQADHPYIAFAEGCTIDNICATNEPFSSNDVEINIPASLPCNPGFSRGGGGGGEEEPIVKEIRIMAEDVAANAGSDIDFNDVVFDVKAEFPVGVETVNTVTITLYAAGGTMPLYIGDVEVHNELGISDVRTMINTNAEAYADGVNYFAQDGVAPKTFELELADAVSKDNFLADVNDNVKITVNNNDNVVPVLAPQGEPSAKIAVPVGTPWAKEKVNMGDAFSQFRSWVNTTMPDKWYNKYDESRVIK